MRTFREKVFKEELLNGNEEEGYKEEGREEKETLTNQRGLSLAKFFAGKTGLRDLVPGAILLVAIATAVVCIAPSC